MPLFKSRPSKADFEREAMPHMPALYAAAVRMTRNERDAEDLVQDAMLRALNYAASYRGGDARAWLLSIVRNTAYDRLGARQKAAVTLATDDGDEGGLLESVRDPADDPEIALSRRQDENQLRRWLDALPLELRECVVLCDLEELSYKEIARIAQVPLGTVMSRLSRARRSLIRMAKEGAA